MSNLILRINEFINRAELEIIENIEEHFSFILNDSIQQLKSFPNLSEENIDELLSKKFSIQTNRLIVRLINKLSFCFWRLVEIIIEYSYQKSSNNLCQLNTIENLLLSHIDLFNEYHQRRAQSSSDTIIQFDQDIYNQLCRIANEICNILTELHPQHYQEHIM
jgi:hypothetical protein